MSGPRPQRQLHAPLALAATALLLLYAGAGTASAQPMMPSGGPDGPRSLAPDKVLQTVGVDQKLDAVISPDITFKNEAGQTVRLGDYLGKRPLLLTLVYYECPGLCTMTLNGVGRALKPLKFSAGKEFDVLTVSFDPKDTPELAARKKDTYVKQYNRPGAEGGWHFLTGDQPNIEAMTKAVGFRYTYDENTKQYAHASAIIVLTPKGHVSRYFYGLEYSTRDIELGLIEAAEERIGSVTDAIVLFCYAYDPAAGKYSLVITRVLKVGAVLTMVTLGGFVGLMLYRERRDNKLKKPPTGNTTDDAGDGQQQRSEILNPQ
jgi:protein SCO1